MEVRIRFTQSTTNLFAPRDSLDGKFRECREKLMEQLPHSISSRDRQAYYELVTQLLKNRNNQAIIERLAEYSDELSAFKSEVEKFKQDMEQIEKNMNHRRYGHIF